MKKDRTLQEILLGILCIGVVIQVILLIFCKQHLYHAIGLWSGIGCSIFWVIHLKRSVEDSLDCGPQGAESYSRKQYVVRVAIFLIVIGVVLYKGWGNPLTILLGVGALQVASYLQPWVHKVIKKLITKKKGGGLCER